MNINGTDGDDDLIGSTSADLILGFGGNDTIIGDAGDDSLSGGAGDDSISGGGTNDHLNGGAGNDTLDGGADFDAAVYDFSSFTTGVQFQGLVSPNNFVTTSQPDGLGGIDTVMNVEGLEIFGGSGADTLSSRDSKDFIDGGDGNDVLTGGAGEDTFAFNTSSSNAGIDLITDLGVRDRIQFTNFIFDTTIPLSNGDGTATRQGEMQIGTYDEASNTTRVYAGMDSVAGADFTVVLQGHYEASQFSRGIVFTGTPYSDLLLVAPLGPQPGQNITGTSGNDVLAGTLGNDTITASGGNDIILGSGGDDVVYGGTGDDRFFGGRGNDTFNGGVSQAEIDANGGQIPATGWDTVVYDFSTFTTAVKFPDYPVGSAPFKFPTNQVPDGLGGTDTLVSISGMEIYGGSAADSLNPPVIDSHAFAFTLIEGNGGDDSIGLGPNGTVAFDTARSDLGVDKIGGWGFDSRILLRNFVFDMTKSLSTGDGTAVTKGEVQFGSHDAATNLTPVYVGTNDAAGSDLNFYLFGQLDLSTFVRTDAGTDAYLSMQQPVLPPEPIIFQGTSGGDNVSGFGANDSLSGGAGRDTLAGAGGDDTLRGDGGDDHLDGGAGNDLLDGGFNYDAAVYNFSQSTAAVSFTGTLSADPDATSTQADGLGGTDTLVNIESLEIYGGSGADTLTGGSAVDFIEGWAGDDVLAGGTGSDTFAFQAHSGDLGTDRITDLGSGDRILLRSMLLDASKPLSSGGGTAVGNGEVQFGTYDPATNTTRIYVGWDDVAGADTTIVLEGQYDPANFTANVVSTGVFYSELLYTPPPPPADPAQTFDGTTLADTFTGGSGNDTIHGGAGGDTLGGAGGDDVIDGQAGTDRLFGGDGQDTMSGGLGSDRLEGGNGHDVLVGGDGNDQIWGDDGADWIQGDDGNDRLTGGLGDDFLVGGIGSDTLVGNAGADTFFFDAGSGIDRIDFFFVSHHDRIRIASNVNGSGILTADDAYAHTTDTVDGALIDLGAGNTVLLAGVHPGGITAAIFEIV